MPSKFLDNYVFPIFMTFVLIFGMVVLGLAAIFIVFGV